MATCSCRSVALKCAKLEPIGRPKIAEIRCMAGLGGEGRGPITATPPALKQSRKRLAAPVPRSPQRTFAMAERRQQQGERAGAARCVFFFKKNREKIKHKYGNEK